MALGDRTVHDLATVTQRRFPEGSQRIKVLVIDDEELMTAMVERMLRKHADVTTAGSAEEALTKLEDGGFDVILCDLSMPGMDGMDMHRHLCAESAASAALADRMIFITGGATTDKAARFLDAMADREVSKPFDRARILAALERFRRDR